MFVKACHFVFNPRRNSSDFMCTVSVVDPSGRAVWGVGLRALSCWDCGFESRQRNGCLCLVSVMRCQVEGSLLRADHSSRGVLPSVVCLIAIEEPHRGGLGPLEVVEPFEKIMSMGL
jgi:hypothetical protein